MKLWRIIENEWNLKAAPWKDAIGIEEIDDDLAVPGVVCWLTSGWPDNREIAQHIVDLHNQSINQSSR